MFVLSCLYVFVLTVAQLLHKQIKKPHKYRERECAYSFRWLTLTDFGVAVVTITLCFASEPNDADRLTDQMPIPNVTRACTEFWRMLRYGTFPLVVKPTSPPRQAGRGGRTEAIDCVRVTGAMSLLATLLPLFTDGVGSRVSRTLWRYKTSPRGIFIRWSYKRATVGGNSTSTGI